MASNEIKTSTDSDNDASMLSKHKKLSVLNFLKENGCTNRSLELKAATKRLYDYNHIVEFIRYSCSSAEAKVNAYYDTVSFNNIQKWLSFFKDTPVSACCDYEAAIVMSTIALNEPQPAEDSSDDINFTDAYNFLANGLLGQGQKPLNETLRKFLSKEFELLIDEANTDCSDELTRKMGICLDKFHADECHKHTHNYSLNPFHQDYSDNV